MHKCTIGLTAIAIATLSPTISSASPDKVSLDACVSTFAKGLTAAGDSVPAYKVIDRAVAEDTSSIALHFESADTKYTYDLEARNSRGEVLARVRCSTNGHGAVFGLMPLPLEGKPPAFAARN
jgi:hypothetical protein